MTEASAYGLGGLGCRGYGVTAAGQPDGETIQFSLSANQDDNVACMKRESLGRLQKKGPAHDRGDVNRR